MNKLNAFTSHSIPQQIETAFSTSNSLAGTLHGQRRIIQGQSGKRTALFPSKKNGGAIPVESRLELTHALNLERDPRVKDYRTQSLYIQLDEQVFAYPDFLIRREDGCFEVHEVKPSIAGLNDQEIKRFDIMENILKIHSINFKLIEASVLPSIKIFNYLMYLYSRGHQRVWTPEEKLLAIRVIKNANALTFSEMHKALIENNAHSHLAEYLVFHNCIDICNKEKSAMNGGSL